MSLVGRASRWRQGGAVSTARDFALSPYVWYWDQLRRYWRAKRLAHKPGWVVLGWDYAEGGEGYHAYHRGVNFGMDDRTGRFPDRQSAQEYASWRNSPEARIHAEGYHFYVEHESMTSLSLLED
ncbi:P53 [Xanthomonas phage phiL7]|uniref:p53 n=1 Tax=Xanthomonas phage phiL7 TaxID=538979 RepID=C4ML53_9CAUD|nr:P53 [Xanthomonas phage phiL7]ACE75793.1 P53 [Xanthomonas phage phiL7]